MCRYGTRMWRRRPLWTSISFSPSSTCWASTAGTFRSLSRRWNRCRTTSVYIYISIHIHIYIYIYIYAYTYTCVYIEEVPIYLSIYLSIYIYIICICICIYTYTGGVPPGPAAANRLPRRGAQSRPLLPQLSGLTAPPLHAPTARTRHRRHHAAAAAAGQACAPEVPPQRWLGPA